MRTIDRSVHAAMVWLVCLLAPLVAKAQLDGVQVLSREVMLQLVMENHPAVKQAGLRSAMGEAAVRTARGAFDPRIDAAYSAKQYAGSSYYELLDAGLRVPTWFGAELYAGLQEHGGPYVNPQSETPDGGFLKAGVVVPMGQGLFIDRRRADLRKALTFQGMAEAERQLFLNQVLFDVLSDHVQWVAAYRRLLVSREAVRQAEVRATAVKGSFTGGDRPAIDTLEALLQVQDRLLRLQDADLEFRNAAVQLSNHLWDPQLRPLEIGPGVVPDTLDLQAPLEATPMEVLIADALISHPRILEQQGRLEQLDIERRFRAEFLKPRLDLRYTLLSGGGVLNGEGSSVTFNTSDHLWGWGFNLPVLLRRERGELGMARLRMNDADLALGRERQVIRTTITARSNELAQMRRQVELGASMVMNYQGLLSGESRRFQAGESSLFLVNQREVALLDAQLKQVELEAKLRLAFFKLEKDAGMLWRSIGVRNVP